MLPAHWVSRFSADDPTNTVEKFKTGYSVSGMAVDSQGNVWVCNRLGNSMRGWWIGCACVRGKRRGQSRSFPDDHHVQTEIWLLSGGSVTVLRPDGTNALLANQRQRSGRPVGGGRGWRR